MNPIELSQHPWSVVVVLILGMGAALRIIHASQVRRERSLEEMLKSKASAEADLYKRMADIFEATGRATTERLGEIVELIHAKEGTRVHDDHDMETRLIQEIRAAVMGAKQDLLREMRNVRIDVRRGQAERMTASEEAEIVDMLHDSSPPEGHDPAVLLGQRKAEGA